MVIILLLKFILAVVAVTISILVATFLLFVCALEFGTKLYNKIKGYFNSSPSLQSSESSESCDDTLSLKSQPDLDPFYDNESQNHCQLFSKIDSATPTEANNNTLSFN